MLSKILLGHQQDKPKAKTGEDGIRAHRGCIRIIASSETCYLFSPPGKERLVGGLVAGSAASPAPLYLTKHLLSLLSPASVRAGAAAASVGNWNWNPKIFGLVAVGGIGFQRSPGGGAGAAALLPLHVMSASPW